jgi:purine-nucleoside phosphorylase
MREEVVYARKDRKDPTIGPVAVMVAMETDVALVRRYMGVRGRPLRRIMNSSLYKAKHGNQSISIVGPMLGAPHAVMILEKLIVLGAKKILFLGWCGSVQESVQIADLLLPDRAMIGEGTSGYYASGNVGPMPSKKIVKAIEDSLEACSIPFHKGLVWSTDAPYRETRQKVLLLQQEEVLGVDMEISALFAAARFRSVEIAALLVVSDELGSLHWKPGFSSSKFKKSRKMAAEIVCSTCHKLGEV